MLCRSLLNANSSRKILLMRCLYCTKYICNLSMADIHTMSKQTQSPPSARHGIYAYRYIGHRSNSTLWNTVSHHTHESSILNRAAEKNSLLNGAPCNTNIGHCHRGLSNFLSPVSVLRKECRGYKGKKNKGREEESSSDSDSDSESDEDESLDDVADNDGDAPAGYKEMKLHVKSLRVDSIVSGGLDIARNRVDELFFANRLRLNGGKLAKKSKQVSQGDYVDVITENLEDIFKVKRVKIVRISSEKTSKDKHIVHTKVWKQPFEILNVDNKEW